jgi:transcriptional regulator with XRE-family HTH domain
MEIKDRIVKIITSEGISPSLFADMIGVQRSSVSHILSGRNNPGLEILQKILTGFPKYNADWLITGRGEVYKKPMQTNLFDAITEASQKEKELVASETEKELLVKNPAKQLTLPDELPQMITKEAITEPKQQTNNIAEIQRIIVFYTDNTFREFIAK